MKITKRRLRRIIREAVGIPTLQQWADQHDLIVDRDPLTGQSVVLIDDAFAMNQGLPDGAQWDVERSFDDDGWIVSVGDSGLEFEEIPSGDLDDLDDLGIDFRSYS
jgi:hypothetical protein